MPTLRLVQADEPSQARENVALRQMLERLTQGTHDKARGLWVLKPVEAQVLSEVLAHRMFSPDQLETIESTIRAIDPHKFDSDWHDRHLVSLVRVAKGLVDRPEWISIPIQRLHAAMRAQGSEARFRLSLCRAALVAFLTIDLLPSEPEELLHLTG
ncbi:hypothetical protein HY630_03635 [Candidatus Uhrbacteria bacterium]|nr:hypothetical protein [Candidatus Uhrbacteria bacterium]